MQHALEEKNEAVVSHVPPSISPLKRRNSSNMGSDDDSQASAMSHKKKRKARLRKMSREHDDDGDESVHSQKKKDDVYLPGIVSPAKISPRGLNKATKAKRRENNDDSENINDNMRHVQYDNHSEISDISHDEGSHNSRKRKKEKPRVRMNKEDIVINDDLKPDPIQIEEPSDVPSVGKVRFSSDEPPLTRKSIGSENTSNKDTISDTLISNMNGPQYIAELLKADLNEEALAQMYETGFEMQMVERGMMETPSAAKSHKHANGRVPV